MVPVVTLLFTFLAWCVATSVILVLGPLFWVLYISRVLLLFGVTTLFHVLMGSDLRLSIHPLEESIDWFPHTFRRLFKFLSDSINKNALRGPTEVVAFDSLVRGDSSPNWVGIAFDWFIRNIVPAAIVWVSIYAIFKMFGALLGGLFSNTPLYIKLGGWAMLWSILALLAQVIRPAIQNAIVFLFIVLVCAAWFFLGLIFSVPAWALGVARFFFALFNSVIRGRNSPGAPNYIGSGFQFYIHGFSKIGNVFKSDGVSWNSEELDSDGFTEENVKRLYVRFLSLLFYPTVFIIWLLIDAFLTWLS